MKNYALVLGFALSLTACNYDNTFTGTYNGNPASMSAYSKNINKYCVALNITAGSETKSTYISAQSVFDSSDFLKSMSFNTKGAVCGSNSDEYLVGNRNTFVMNISRVSRQENAGYDYCRQVTYKQYQYREDITFETKKNATDETTGTFTGTGTVDLYVDTNHPENYGPIYYCGIPRPMPGPYPRPNPRPRPFPRLNSGVSVSIGIGIGHRR